MASETETLLATARRIVPGVEWCDDGVYQDLYGYFPRREKYDHPAANVWRMYENPTRWVWARGPEAQRSPVLFHTPEAALTALRDAIRAEAGRLLAMVGEALPEKEASDGN